MRNPSNRTRTIAAFGALAVAGGLLHMSTASAMATPKDVAAGTRHTCAVMAEGAVRCWGDNRLGQLGDGTTIKRTGPVTVVGTAGTGALAGVTKVVAGTDFTCAIAQKRVYCWGANASGQLGNSTTVASSKPVLVKSFSAFETAVSISAGANHTCASVTGIGRVACWGDNSSGQLGDGTTTNRSFPVTVTYQRFASTVFTGARHSCYSTGRDVRCWGDNAFGQLGDGTFVNRARPVAPKISGTVKTVGVGQLHTCVSTIPVAPTTTTTMLPHETTTTAASPSTTLSRTTTTLPYTEGPATTWCWGYNASGQLGSSSGAKVSTPTPVTSLTAALRAIGGGYLHTCAVVPSQLVYCWGSNAKGQLGNGTTANSSIPVRVFPNASALSVGYAHVCAVDWSGVKCWGDNSSGQLGTGTSVNASAPTPVLGL